MMQKKNSHPWMMGLAGMVISASAAASIQLPTQPVGPQQFDSFLACEAYLNQRHADDLQGTDGPPTPLENGGTREKLLKTEGVLQTGPEAAHYEARVSWVVRFINEARHAKQTNYLFEDVDLTCAGTTLRGTMHRGHAKPQMTPLPQEAEMPGGAPAH
ncbi:hypothetical protein [Ralstonia sp. 24A2]|uniref:hypothetical protein n=1 Tax=Ralstonia sp. 24A2 TaxID=3447364 RepID=UPI003F697F5F